MNLAARGTNIIKCFLHISPGVQKERLAARLNDPAKYWKYDPGDLDTRSKWAEYIEAYNELLSRCNPDVAPWYIIRRIISGIATGQWDGYCWRQCGR